MRTWDDAIKRGLNMFVSGAYAYFYGAKGELLTDAKMEALWKASPNYFAKYTAVQKKQIFDYSRGKIGVDCSGFVALCTGDCSYSTAMIEHCSTTTRDLVAGVAGSVLYTTFNGSGRHVGIDIGYGYFLHAPAEMHSIEMGKISVYPWEISGQTKYLDYTGADAR